MQDSLRIALWWLLPKDGDFRRASDGVHYYLARQGRRVVLRGGNVTSLLHESRLHWIHDPNPNQSHRVKPKQTVPRTNNDTVPRNNHNTVPRNNNFVQNSDSHARSPLETIPSASWYNSNLPLPSASSPRKNVSKHSQSVPKHNNHENSKTTQVVNSAKCSSPPPKKKRDRKYRRERREREREKTKVLLLFMMRAGPVRAQQFQAVQSFQQE